MALTDESHSEVIVEEDVSLVIEAVPEAAAVVAEGAKEEDKNYQWLGFKADLDDDELVKRPIPKMSELILEGEETLVADVEKSLDSELLETVEVQVSEAVLEQPQEPTVEVIVASETLVETAETITAESSEVIPDEKSEENSEEIQEEDDSKY